MKASDVSRFVRLFFVEVAINLMWEMAQMGPSDASRDYILLYRGDREALSGSLDRIQRAASVILKAVSDCG